MPRSDIAPLSRKNEVCMTEGSIFRHLLNFAIPLLLGNLFQQMYNMVDTWVVGNFVSNEAYSAVGSVAPVINTLIGFFSGFSSGAGILISQYFGAKKYDHVQQTVHTAVAATLILAILFTAVGIGIVPLMLKLMNTPSEVFQDAKSYLTIYFSGIIGLMLYNMGASILRAIGDSRRPFYYLVVAALINCGLDLFFVIVLEMGVAGVALATILAQFTSATLVGHALFTSRSCIQLYIRHLRINWAELRKIVKIGLPAALQLAITSFSNVFVQSYINYFGKDFMSGWTTFLKVENILFLPKQSLSLAITTFVGQNLGQNNIERARKGTYIALLMTFVATVVLIFPIIIFAPHIVKFFNAEPGVIQYGTMMLRSITAFHVFGCINQVFSGALRGTGNSRAPMLIMLSSFVAFRQVYLYLVSVLTAYNPLLIVMGYPAGWVVCSVVMLVYSRKTFLFYHRPSSVVPCNGNR